jgi:hypothetical protein
VNQSLQVGKGQVSDWLYLVSDLHWSQGMRSVPPKPSRLEVVAEGGGAFCCEVRADRHSGDGNI